MFKEILEEIVDGVDGGLAGLVMGYDGIPLDNYVASDREVEIDTLGMEFSQILQNIRTAAEMLEVGTASEVAVRAERLTMILRLLTDDYFVAIALGPEANVGKARFLVRTRAHKLAEALS